MHDLIDAKSCVSKLRENGIVRWGDKNFAKLKSKHIFIIHKNTIPGKKRSIYIYEEVVAAVKKNKNHAYESQSKANDKKRKEKQVEVDNGIFNKSLEPQNSVATMSDEEKKKRDEELAATFKKLEEKSSEEENETRPGADASGQDWNVFKTKQQALNYELDRKMKEATLMHLDDFKSAAEILIAPLNQGLSDFAFQFKAQFPNVSDDAIQWILKRTNQLKVDVQNVSV